MSSKPGPGSNVSLIRALRDGNDRLALLATDAARLAAQARRERDELKARVAEMDREIAALKELISGIGRAVDEAGFEIVINGQSVAL